MEPGRVNLGKVEQASRYVMSEEMVEARLFAGLYKITQMKDRRPEGRVKTNHATGLPESPNDMETSHRRIKRGVDLLLESIISPRQFIMACMETDELPENIGKTEDQKAWRSLVVLEDNLFTEGMAVAVDENTRTLKRLLNKLAERGLFDLEPEIDDTGELGTKRLIKGVDGLTMGFRPTYACYDFLLKWAKLNADYAGRPAPKFEEILGKHTEKAKQIPQWKQAEDRQGAAPVEISTGGEA